MEYEHSLTYAVQMQVDGYIQTRGAQAGARLNRCGSARELLPLLIDPETISTPGFVLRRHIQAQGVVRGLDCADLSRTGNVPWPEAVTQQAAAQLSSLSYRRHRLAISTVNWYKYLTDAMPKGIQRGMIFKLAVVAGMGREETLELLLACGESPYNVRRPLELLCWFCQGVPGVYTWADIKNLLERYEAYAARKAEGEAVRPEPVPDATRLLLGWANELLDPGLPSAPEARQRLLERMAQVRGELQGFSRTAQAKYLRLTDYLRALYTPPSPVLSELVRTMYRQQELFFDDVRMNSRGKLYTFRGEPADRFGPQREEYVFGGGPGMNLLGKVAMFCKRYPLRAGGIANGREAVDRRDILLLGYFLITGYRSAGAAERSAFWALAQEDGSMDRRISLIREELDALAREPDIPERQVRCRRVLNELLAELNFQAFYVPALFDRWVLFALLTRRPARTVCYFLGEDLGG